ncbi:hypothetical protein ANO14919_126470 [Xylariales sp. No.14919]|nr:hypothetical protein ANO14919_126470 [Xylariales sp. No.14919]
MPYGTRSRRRQSRPALAPPRDPSHERESQRDDGDLTRSSSPYSAMFSLSRSSPMRSKDGSETLLTPTPTYPRDEPSPPPPKTQDQAADGSMDAVLPCLTLQDAFQPTTAHRVEDSQPRHIQITHFDFSEYRPSTPGSKSHPIKIEGSPGASPSWPISSRKPSTHQEPLALPTSCLDTPAIRHDHQFDDANYMRGGRREGDSLVPLPAGLGELSATEISIMASPKAATTILYLFLAAEEYWIRSHDHDMDPDINFWKKLVAQFNLNTLGDRVDTWVTARRIVTHLCDEPYKAHLRQQSHITNDIYRLISVIDDCCEMSKYRRWEWQSGFKNIKTSSSNNINSEGDAQKDILERRPQTIEDHKKLIQALEKRCAEQRCSNGSATEISTGHGPVHLKPLKASPRGPSTRNGNTRLDVPANPPHSPGVMGRNPNKTSTKRRNNKQRGGHPHSSAKDRRRARRRASSRYTAQEMDHLEQRLRELEHEIKSRRQPRCY